jgi:hypothetical protein
MPSFPDPWDAYRTANGVKKTTLELDKQIQDHDLNIVKQLRELDGLEKRETEIKRKIAEATSDVIREFHQSELKRLPESKARASAWLAINRAKKAQLLVEFDINSREYGDLQKDIWTSDKEAYVAFRDLLEKV